MADLKVDSLNIVKKGQAIYSYGEEMNSISLVNNGRILAFDAGTKTVFSNGAILGFNNLNMDSYNMSYIAADDVQLYTFDVKNSDDLTTLLDDEFEYRYMFIDGLSKQIAEMYKVYCEYEKMASGLKVFMNNTYRMLKEFSKNCGIDIPSLRIIEKMPVIELEGIKDSVDYYINVNGMDLSLKEKYFSHSTVIASRHIEEEIDIINKILSECEKLNSYIQLLIGGIISSGDCLLSIAAQITVDAIKLKQNKEIPFSLFEKIKMKCSEIDKLFANKSGRKIDISKERIEQISALFDDETNDVIEKEDKSSKTTVKYAGTDDKVIMDDVDKTFEKLLEYGNLSDEKKDEFRKELVLFIKLKDKNSTEDDVRKLRQKLTVHYYELYEKVFLRRCLEKNENRVIDLFLIYGFLDERLLSKDQIIELYCYDENKDDINNGSRVYNAKEWLEAIYDGKKEPSKNEFDLDYHDNLRELKKNKSITDEQYKKDVEDSVKKVSFEIKNLYHQTSRMVSGQASIFVPFIYKECFMGHLDQSFTTAEQVSSILMDIRNIDYSVFFRERMISEPDKKIDKEFIQEEFWPDVILVPVYGSNACMWQDIEGKKRSSNGRFVLPAFSEIDMEDNLIRLCGRFRWELCKTIQGINWNNIQMKSLTSEYMDYIQFYRKNHNLSDERKEKIKLQIQKGRGNYREIFVIDYLAWIKNESNGAMRLNKVARELMATHCPFNAEIRNKLSAQPLFEEAMGKYRNQKNKKIKELNMRYQNYKNRGIAILPSMEITMDFYKNM